MSSFFSCNSVLVSDTTWPSIHPHRVLPQADGTTRPRPRHLVHCTAAEKQQPRQQVSPCSSVSSSSSCHPCCRWRGLGWPAAPRASCFWLFSLSPWWPRCPACLPTGLQRETCEVLQQRWCLVQFDTLAFCSSEGFGSVTFSGLLQQRLLFGRDEGFVALLLPLGLRLSLFGLKEKQIISSKEPKKTSDCISAWKSETNNHKKKKR